MGARRAAQHVPAYATALMQRYESEMDAVRRSGGKATGEAGGSRGATAAAAGTLQGLAAAALDALFILK